MIWGSRFSLSRFSGGRFSPHLCWTRPHSWITSRRDESGALSVTVSEPVVTEFRDAAGSLNLTLSRPGAIAALSADEGVRAPADFNIASNSDWGALMAMPDTELSGKVAEITGPLDNIVLRDGIAPASRLTITCSGAGRINRISLGNYENVLFEGCVFQMTGWPAEFRSTVQFTTGVAKAPAFHRCTFRHGYGVAQSNFVTDFEYPEYQRPDSIFDAVNTSVTRELPWLDSDATSGRIYIFNNGSEPAYIKVGGPDVVASTADKLLPVSSGYSSISADPTVDTHYAIISGSGAVEVNARPEIGLGYYLASAFASYGSSAIEGGVEIIDCVFEDLSNAVKGLPPQATGNCVFWRNTLRRTYQDTFALSLRGASAIYVVDNLIELPFARSGIAQDLFGQAGDPHTDGFQMFADGVAPIENVYIFGNVFTTPPLLPGVSSQGGFISDNDFNPSYRNVFFVGNFLPGGSTNGIASGEAGFPVEGLLSYGDTIVSWENISNSTIIRAHTDRDGDAVVIGSITTGILSEGAGQTMTDGAVIVPPDALATDVFPNWEDRLTATDRAGVVSAWTGAGIAAGAGYAAVSHLFDFAADTVEGIFDIDAAHPGVAWNDIEQVAKSAVVELGARRVLLGANGQPIVPAAGVEVQITSDGTTVITDWTSTPTTVDRGQWVNLRAASSNDDLTAVDVSADINGYSVGASIATGVSLGDTFALAADTAFVDPFLPEEKTTVVEFEFKGRINSPTATFDTIFAQVSAIRAQVRSDASRGEYRIGVEDGAGSPVLSDNDAFKTLDGLAANGVAIIFNVLIDYPNRVARLTINGQSEDRAFDSVPVTDFAQTAGGRVFVLNGSSETTEQLPAGTEVEHMRIYTTVDGVRGLRKEISLAAQGSLAGINADPWKVGGDAT